MLRQNFDVGLSLQQNIRISCVT